MGGRHQSAELRRIGLNRGKHAGIFADRVAGPLFKRSAEAMIRKGTAPAIDYVIKSSDNGRFEIVWKIAKTEPTTDEVETEIAEASADQPVAASPTEAASQPAPAATEPGTADAAPQHASEAEVAS